MGKDDKVVSILAYIIVGIIWYFVDQKVQNTTTKFHVKQALHLLIVAVALGVAFSILGPIIGLLTLGIGLLILMPIMWLVNLAVFVLWIIGLISAINLNQKEIPVIGKYATKYLTF